VPQVYIGLGSNLAQPLAQLRDACQALARLPDSQLLALSSAYASDPLGLHTQLAPLALLDALQGIEQAHGRQRKAERWGPRTLDLDILLYGEQRIDLPRLQVPHYHMHARAFVLYPLAEIAGELILPDGRRLSELLAQCPYQGLERLEERLLDEVTA
jgi:2-amino-4-hydroxy-6-hydroxymethyldihydropteridine diphosphokinase